MEDYKWLETLDKRDLIKLLNEILPDLYAEIEENKSYDNLSGHLYNIDNILSKYHKSAIALQTLN
jgi:hypothetical protein